MAVKILNLNTSKFFNFFESFYPLSLKYAAYSDKLNSRDSYTPVKSPSSTVTPPGTVIPSSVTVISPVTVIPSSVTSIPTLTSKSVVVIVRKTHLLRRDVL